VGGFNNRLTMGQFFLLSTSVLPCQYLSPPGCLILIFNSSTTDAVQSLREKYTFVHLTSSAGITPQCDCGKGKGIALLSTL
jgi:hypothetical protein